ncbi:ABC transporter substrate-binding protein [Paeniglutamicibacter cryotolerans]|uniref:NitT/TauT family transport system substrate-binding protein n=2 Tax=Paeniglutamicibacter cryotolerans TaxID=670079 RepID=A0A839QNN8_9MICC|nr:ABC transporter substrate-binding protein [Paeniglutamicibacter cryotolerans]MBB2994822.1 NitT/TauT family transport system substrate-binding protein [Paeniglutamicibacter cryotolerans]
MNRSKASILGRRTFMGIAAVAFTSLSLTACSPSVPGASAGSDSGMEKITIGLLPITDVAPIYLGIQQGFFKEENLDPTIQLAQGGAAIIPAVVSGEYQFGYSNVVSLMVAHGKGIPIQVTSNGSTSTNLAGKDTTEVAALPASGISTMADLKGKTVALNALNNFGDITMRASLEKAGVDPSTVKFVEIPYPNMPAQLAAGEIDAAWTTEPFRTQILSEGGEIVGSPMTDMAENFDAAYYFTSKKTATENPELVKRYNAAVEKSFDYATKNPDAVRTIIQDYAGLSPDIAAKVELSQWPMAPNEVGLQKLADAAQKYGVLSQAPDFDGFFGR